MKSIDRSIEEKKYFKRAQTLNELMFYMSLGIRNSLYLNQQIFSSNNFHIAQLLKALFMVIGIVKKIEIPYDSIINNKARIEAI